MARHKDTNWNLPEGTPSQSGGKEHDSANVHSALLMDIRDELKDLNRLLRCHNFTGFPATLRSIRRALAKKRKPRPAAKPAA